MEKYFDTRLNPEFRKGADIVWRLVAADILRRLPHEPSKVLDLGAGYGDFINQVRAADRWAADLWPGLEKNVQSGVKSVVGDITTRLSGIPVKHFSLCFMSNVLEHFSIEDAQKILGHVQYYLDTSGYLVILQPNFTYCSKNYFDDYTHKTIFTAEGLCNFLMDNGFAIELTLPRYLPFSFKSRLPRPNWAVALYLRLPWKPMAAQMLIIAKKKESTDVEK